MIQYPESWSYLANGELRLALLAFLKELANREFQRRSDEPPEKQFDIDEVFHFFFDDTDFSKDPSSYIGEALFDTEESDSIIKLTKSLDNVFQAVGDESTSAYIQHPLWEQVVDDALIAYACLQQGRKRMDFSHPEALPND